MKFAKFAAVFLLSVALLTAAFITIFSSADTNEDLSDSKTDISTDVVSDSSELNNTDAAIESITSQDNDSSSSEDTSATDNTETEKTVLGEVNAGDASLLNDQAVTWGPGANFNDANQPTACVSLQEKYGDLGAVFLHGDNKIYLTFDLGYESGYTNDILDVLKANNVKATFFLTGSYARNQDEIIQRIIDEGHTVGNHSNTHPDMTTVSDEQVADEIMQVHNVIKDKYGYESYLFRFPAGAFSEKTLAIAAQNGYHSVFWSFAYNDWDNANQPDAAEALKKTTERLHPGAVYLLHPMETNSLILDSLIKAAQGKGNEIGVM